MNAKRINILAVAVAMGICVAVWGRVLTAPRAEASTLQIPTTSLNIALPQPTTTSTVAPTTTEAPVEDTTDPDVVSMCLSAISRVQFAELADPAFCVPAATGNYAYYYYSTRSIEVEEHADMTQEIFDYTTSHERMHEWDWEHLLTADRDQIMARFTWPDWNVEVWAETANRCERPQDSDGFDDGHPGWFFGQYNELLSTYTDSYGGSPTDDMCSWLFAAGMLPTAS